MSRARAMRLAALLLPWALWLVAGSASAAPVEPPALAGIPIDFILFAATLVGIALFHHHTLPIAVGGLTIISLWKIGFSPFTEGPAVGGWVAHFGAEWVMLTNLLGLLLGFALLSKHFEASRVPEWLPRFLPDDWKGGLVLLVMIFVLSSFLDNIAAALIGGTIAGAVFRGKVHIGYLAAIVAASNAGGSGSVVGDTTTTMMWIDGVNPLQVLEAYIAAGTAMLIFGVPASLQQQRYSPITREPPVGIVVDWARVFIVALMLVAAIVVNVLRPFPFHRRRSLGRAPRLRPPASAGVGRVAECAQGQHLPAFAGPRGIDDAGAQASRCVVAGGDGAGFRLGRLR